LIPPLPRDLNHRKLIPWHWATRIAAGLLLIVARGRESSEPEGQMPWPLTRAELSAFAVAGLEQISFEDLLDSEDPAESAVRRFRALYRFTT